MPISLAIRVTSPSAQHANSGEDDVLVQFCHQPRMRSTIDPCLRSTDETGIWTSPYSLAILGSAISISLQLADVDMGQFRSPQHPCRLARPEAESMTAVAANQRRRPLQRIAGAKPDEAQSGKPEKKANRAATTPEYCAAGCRGRPCEKKVVLISIKHRLVSYVYSEYKSGDLDRAN